MSEHNIMSISGGKDSTALLLVGVVREVENIQPVFADTGHEHPKTYDYIRYLSDWLTSRVTFFNNGTKGGLSIMEAVEWSKTSRGGRQIDLLRSISDGPQCSSIYGLCE